MVRLGTKNCTISAVIVEINVMLVSTYVEVIGPSVWHMPIVFPPLRQSINRTMYWRTLMSPCSILSYILGYEIRICYTVTLTHYNRGFHHRFHHDLDERPEIRMSIFVSLKGEITKSILLVHS